MENLKLVLEHSPYKPRTAKVLTPAVYEAAQVELDNLEKDATAYRRLIDTGEITRGDWFPKYVLDLEADAQRFQGLRLIMLEHNEALQEKFFDVLEQVVPLDPDALPTPEQLNVGIDVALFECAKLRRQCKGVNCTSDGKTQHSTECDQACRDADR